VSKRDWSSDVCSSDLHWLHYIFPQRPSPYTNLQNGVFPFCSLQLPIVRSLYSQLLLPFRQGLNRSDSLLLPMQQLNLPPLVINYYEHESQFQIGRASCRERESITKIAQEWITTNN